MSSRAFLLSLFALALGVRLVLGVLVFHRNILEGDVQYDIIATNLANGGAFLTRSIEGLDPAKTGVREDFHSFRPPVYPLLLAGFYRLVGRSPLSLALLQATISALVPVVLFLAVRRCFSDRVAALAAVASAVYPYHLYHDIRVVDTPLFELWLGGLVLCLMHVAERATPGRLVAAGVLLGLTMQTRSFFLAFPAALLWWAALVLAPPVRRAGKVLAVVLGVCALTLIPWASRNYALHHRLVLGTTYGGWNFFLGNNTFALEAAKRGVEVDRQLVESLNEARVNLAGLSETELDRWFYRRGADFVAAEPRTAFRLWLYKIRNLWSPLLNPPSESRLVNLMHALSYGLILGLGGLGIALSLRHWNRYSLLYLLFLYFTVVYSAYLTMSRYRKPMDNYLIAFSVYALDTLLGPRGRLPSPLRPPDSA